MRNKSVLRYIIIQICLFILVRFFNEDLAVLELFSLIIPIILLLINTKICGQLISLYNIFVLVTCIFHFGEFWLDLFGIPIDTSNGHDIFQLYDKQHTVTSLVFALSSLLILNTAATFVLKRIPRVYLPPADPKDYKVAKIIFFILMPLMIYNDFDRVILTQMYSYSEAVYMTTFLGRFEICFIISGLFILTDKKKLSKFVFYYLFIRAVLLMTLTGSRIGMILEIILILYVYTINTKVSTKKVFGLSIIAYAGLVLIGFVKANRGTFNVSLHEFITNGGILASQLSEFGSTMETLILAVTYDSIVGSINGLTYLAAILTIFPMSTSVFPFIVKYRVAHDFLNPYAPSVGTLGGSFFAEQYINFGDLGMLLSVIFGILFAKLQNAISSENNVFKSLLSISVFYGILIYSRANMYDFIATICGMLYFLLAYWILSKMIRI